MELGQSGPQVLEQLAQQDPQEERVEQGDSGQLDPSARPGLQERLAEREELAGLDQQAQSVRRGQRV